MKKILMIAYYFPPISGSGVQRTLKFAKYLPQFDWKPYILTVKEGYFYYEDKSLKRDIVSEVEVIRTRSIEPMKWVRRWLKRKSEAINKKEEKSAKGKKPKWLVTLKEIIFAPDTEIFWIPFAVWKGLRIIKKEKIDIIWSTSSPYSCHLIALCLKKLTGKPWIADFRDPWVKRFNFPEIRWRYWFDSKLELLVLKNADEVINVTRVITENFRKKYPKGRYETITNGYDEDDLIGLEGYYRVNKFTITYTGIFDKKNTPRTFLLSLRKALELKPEMQNRILVRFVGQIDNPGETYNFEFLKKMGFDNIIQLIEYKPHTESLIYALSTDVLLLIVDDVPGKEGVMTGKIFEYLRVGKPILALIPKNGVAAEIISQTHSGIIIDSTSVDEAANAIIELYKLYLKNELSNKFIRKSIEKYNRINLTKRLAMECNNISSHGF